MFKDFLLNLKKQRETDIENTRAKIKSSEDVNEVRALSETLEKLKTELEEVEKQLAETESASKQEEEKEEGRSLNPLASYGMKEVKETRTNTDQLATLEYRQAFMKYAQTGEMSSLLKRADNENVSEDLGVLLPSTVVKEIIKGVEKVYGHLYSKVRKLNVKGGVKFPIGSFSATFYWDGTAGNDQEHGVSEKQKAGAVDKYVQFTYHIGEVRIAQSLLQSIVSVEVFEQEIVKTLVEAYVKAMDVAIMTGDGVKQANGILTEAAKGGSGRIPTENIIEINETEMKDWKTWQKKLFAKIPLSMRALRPEFVMNAETYEGNILTLEDSNGRPIASETFNPVNGDEIAKFKGRDVVFVEDDIFKPFDEATAGTDFFGMYWVPEKAYAVNTNLQFGYKRYFDENTNQYITKGLVIIDGQPLDTKYIYLLKKGSK